MLEFKNLEEMKPYFDKKTNTYRFDGVVQFCFDFLADSNIDAWNINARNINARNIDAGNIDALDIDAEDIEYYAVCIAYQTFSCRSVRGKRENAIHACLDGEIEYREEGADDGNKRNEKED